MALKLQCVAAAGAVELRGGGVAVTAVKQALPHPPSSFHFDKAKSRL